MNKQNMGFRIVVICLFVSRLLASVPIRSIDDYVRAFEGAVHEHEVRAQNRARQTIMAYEKKISDYKKEIDRNTLGSIDAPWTTESLRRALDQEVKLVQEGLITIDRQYAIGVLKTYGVLTRHLETLRSEHGQSSRLDKVRKIDFVLRELEVHPRYKHAKAFEDQHNIDLSERWIGGYMLRRNEDPAIRERRTDARARHEGIGGSPKAPIKTGIE